MQSSTRQRGSNKQDISKEKDDKQRRQTSPVSASLNATTSNVSQPEQGGILLEELKKLRKENQEGHNQTKMSLERLEQAVADIKEQMGEHEERIKSLEERVGITEDTAMRQQRVLRYLLHRDIELSATCDDLQNRLRRNNIRIFQIPEGSEGGNMAGFVKDLLHKVLKLPAELDVRIERAHRSLQSKPKDPAAPPRSIIVRFLDAAVKDAVIRQAWSQRQVFFQDRRIFFDQDYSPELQKKREKVREVIKQLKKKDVQANCIYPARLKLKMNTGDKTFDTLTSAAAVLKDLGVEVRGGERERFEEELKEGWRSSAKRKSDLMIPTSDLKALLQGED